MNYAGFRFYEELRLQSLRAMPIPHITIFLNADPALCSERISRRGRVRARVALLMSGLRERHPGGVSREPAHAVPRVLEGNECTGINRVDVRLDQLWAHTDGEAKPQGVGTHTKVADAVVKAETHVWTPEQIQKFKDL